MPSPFTRMRAILLHEFFLTRQSLEMFFDVILFPFMNVVMFGLITAFLGGDSQSNARALILGVLLWEVIYINQYNVAVSTMWSVWSHNLSNIFIAPISITEYLFSHVIAAGLRALITMVILGVGTGLFFHFNILGLGILQLAIFFLSLSIFAWSAGIVMLGLIFRFGTRVQAISWGSVFLIQPLVAAFYPVSILPGWLQFIAHCLPPTYIFEAARQLLKYHSTNWRYILVALLLNGLYVLGSVLFFRQLFWKSRSTGQLARNDL